MMPLVQGYSKKAISKNISGEMKRGKPRNKPLLLLYQQRVRQRKSGKNNAAIKEL
jgi:hypothetical protein